MGSAHRRLSFGLGLALVLAASPAAAIVSGFAPAKVKNWRLTGSVSSAGRALMIPGPYYAEINSVLLPESSATISGSPWDAEVQAAYLFWSASTPRSLDQPNPPDGPDFDIDLTVATGTFYGDLSALDPDPAGFNRCVEIDGLGGFYYCRRDVTAEVRAQGTGHFDGTYTVGGVDADPGTLNYSDPDWIHAQAKYAGWSLVIVWRSASYIQRRDVVLYDGFYRLDEDATSAGVHTMTIGDFLVASPVRGEIRLFGLEGDRQLGVPPENFTGCPTCWDFVAFKSQTAPSFSYLSNGENPQYNTWNSTPDTSIDLDTYTLDSLLRAGDVSAQIRVGSGDGVVPGGNGENFFLGWVLLSLDTVAPNFGTARTRKQVFPTTAGGGERLTYVIEVTNDGTADATGVVVQDSIPAGTTYVAGSTRVDGVARADVGGTSPLVAGLGLGTIPYRGDNNRLVTFEVRVRDDVPCNSTISNTATVSATGTDPVTVGPAVTTIAPPQLGSPTKAVATAIPGGRFEPGAAFTYTITISNLAPLPQGGVSVSDVLPSYVNVSTVIAPPGASTTIAGGVLTVTDISLPASGSAQVVVLATIYTVAQFGAAGVAEASIDGTRVDNRATIQAGCGVSADTNLASFTVVHGPSFGASSKAVINRSDATPPAEPGDTLEFTISVHNSGNAATSVTVTDALPAYTTYVPGSTSVDGAPILDLVGQCPLVAGYNLGSVAAGATRTISFLVTISDTVPDGHALVNTAHLLPPAFPARAVDVSSPPLVVHAAPDLSTSTKAALDLNGGTLKPGDLVEFTVTVRNTGNVAAQGVVVSDVLDLGLVFVSAADGGTYDGARVTWPAVASLAKGASLTRSFRARVLVPWTRPTTTISNAAEIDCAQLAPFTTPAVLLVVDATPQLSLTKAVQDLNGAPARPGDALRFTLTLTNSGDASASNVVVTDALDANLTGVVVVGGTLVGSVARWTSATLPALANLGPGASVTLTLDAVLRSPLRNGTVVSNSGQAQADNAPAVSSNTVTLTIVSSATLVLHKTVVDGNGGSWEPGDPLRYTIVAQAAGDSPLWDLTLRDVLPAQLDQVVAEDGGVYDGTAVVWTWAGDALLPGASLTVHLTARVKPDTANNTVVSNQAELSTPALAGPQLSDDPGTPAPGDPTRFTVVALPRLSLTKAVALVAPGDTVYNPGDRVRYTLTVTNNGTAAASAVTLTDGPPLDPALTALDPGSGVLAGGGISWGPAQVPALASLAVGASASVSFEATIARPLDHGTVVANRARAACAEVPAAVDSDDPATPVLGDETRFTVTSAPDFSTATKVVTDLNGGSARPGDRLRYTLTITNTGGMNATGVQVRDDLASLGAFARLTAIAVAGGSLSGSVITWDVGGLAVDASVSLSFEATIVTPLDNGTLIRNQALVTSAQTPSGTPTDDPATMTADDPTLVQVVAAADLTGSTKLVTDEAGAPIASARPGQRVRYVIGVRNTGDASARQVVVRDALPAGVTFVSADHGGALQGNEVVWTASGEARLAEVAPLAAPIELSFVVSIDRPADPGLLLNQARLQAQGMVAPALSDFDLATPGSQETPLTIVAAADLSGSTKQITDLAGRVLTSARPGDSLRFVIVVSNSGDGWARNARVSDAIDTGLLTAIVPRDGGVFNGSTVTWTAAGTPALAKVGLGPAGNVTLTFEARLRSPLDPATLRNQAMLSADGLAAVPSDDPATPALDDATALAIVSAADLSTSRKAVSGDDAGRVAPGDALTYTITVVNSGDAAARNVVVRDVLDANLEAIVPGQGGVLAGGVITWSLGTLQPGQAAARTLTFGARVKPLLANGTHILNHATLVGTGLPERDTNTIDLVVVSAPNLAGTTKDVSPRDGEIGVGDQLTYTITVRNSGNAPALDVVVTDRLPAALAPLAADQGGVIAGATVTWGPEATPDLRQLLPGAELVLTFTAVVQPGTPDGALLANQAELTEVSVGERFVSDDPATPALGDPTVVTARFADLGGSTKEGVDLDGGSLAPRDAVRFTIRVVNRGSYTASNVRVSDDLDANLRDVLPGQGGVLVGSRLQWSAATTPALAAIAPGQAVTLDFVATLAPYLANQTRVRNRARIVDDQRQVETNEVVLTVVAFPDLSDTTKTVAPAGDVEPGAVLAYTITVPNRGTTLGTRVELRDQIPPELEVLTISAGGQQVGDELVWQLGTVYPDEGAAAVVGFTARVRDDVPNYRRVPNQAQVGCWELPGTAPSDDPATPERDDPTTVRVLAAPLFAGSTLTVQDENGGLVQPGDRLRYRAQVINTGNRVAAAATIRAAVPAHTRYLPDSTRLNGQALPDDAGGFPLAAAPAIASPAADAPGVVLIDDGVEPEDERPWLTWAVVVDQDAAPGTVIAAQYFVAAADLAAVGSDDPGTPELAGDPTTVVVGGGPALAATKDWALLQDRGVTGQVDVGDVVGFMITVVNAGDQPAAWAQLLDPVPERASYLPGSLTLAGLPLTDAAADDAGEFVPAGPGAARGALAVRLPELAPGASVTVDFAVTVQAGPQLANQASVSTAAGRVVLSDGDPSLPGEQPTLVPVGDSVLGIEGVKTVADLDGGLVAPGDLLRYTITLVNHGALDLAGLELLDELPPAFSAVTVSALPGGASVAIEGLRVRVSGLACAADQRLELVLDARLRDDLTLGAQVTNQAFVGPPGALAPLPPVTVVVGAGGEGGVVSGRAWRDLGARGGDWQEGVDQGLEGFWVALAVDGASDPGAAKVSVPGLGQAVVAAQAGPGGQYSLTGVPSGRYVAYLLSAGGTQYARRSGVLITPAGSLELPLRVDPSGVLYAAGEDGATELVAGARLTLLDDDTGQPVEAAQLGLGQQDQLSTAQGLYQFDAPPGRYRLQVVPPVSYVFPSALRPPQGASADQPLGVLGTPPAGGLVVADDWPRLDQAVYYLRFDLGAGGDFHNNHVPLDALRQRVTISKHASRASASVGDVVTYTISVVNPTGAPLTVGADGGVELLDRLPPGLRYVPGSARLDGLVAGVPWSVGPVSERLADAAGGRELRVGPFGLPAESQLRLRYHAVVSIRAPRGRQTNTVQLVRAGGQTTLSPAASATVLVVEDPLFDRGTVLGRVFCSAADASSEMPAALDRAGLPGVVVANELGWVATSDADGRFHFAGVATGRHLFKLDEQGLPPGSRVAGGPRRELYVTPGLPAKLDFPVACALAAAGPDKVRLLGPPAEAAPAAARTALVTADLRLPAIALDGEAQALPVIDVGAVPGGAGFALDGGSQLNLRTPAPIDLLTRLPQGWASDEWELVFFREDSGAPVWRFWGRGTPPERIPWDLSDGRSLLLNSGTPYLYRLAVLSGGDLGESPWRRLAVGYSTGDAHTDEPLEVATLREDHFSGPGGSPGPRLKARLLELGRELAQRPGVLLVEAHASGAGEAVGALLETRQQAEAVAGALAFAGVARERLEPVGKGNSQPLRPPLGARNRALNQRLVLRLAQVSRPLAPLPPVDFPARVRVQGQELAIPFTERLEHEVAVQPGERVRVELRQRAGHRVVLDRAYPFGAGGGGGAATAGVSVAGDLRGPALTVGGTSVPLPLLTVGCALERATYTLAGGALDAPLRFAWSGAPADYQGWGLRVYGPGGALVYESGARGAPPEQVSWDGLGSGGALALAPGRYTWRYLASDARGELLGPPGSFTVSAAAGGAEDGQPLFKRVFDGLQLDEPVPPAVLAELDELAVRALGAEAGTRLELTIHGDDEGGALKARLATQRYARGVQQHLRDKLPAERLTVKAMGSGRPRVPNMGPRNKAKNRRIEARLLAPPAPAADAATDLPAPAAEPPQVRVAGEDLALGADGSFSGEVMVPASSHLVLLLRLPDQRELRQRLTLLNGKPVLGVSDHERQYRQGPASTIFGSTPAELAGPSAPPRPGKAVALASALLLPSLHQRPDGQLALVELAADGPRRPRPIWVARLDGGWPAASAGRFVLASGQDDAPARAAERRDGLLGEGLSDDAATEAGPPGARPTPAPDRQYPRHLLLRDGLPGDAEAQAGEDAASDDLARLLHDGLSATIVDPAAAPGVAAADLLVYWPVDARLRGRRLTLRGRTAPANVLTVADQRLTLDPDGGFATSLTLGSGPQTVTVRTLDPAGNSAWSTRTLQVPDRGWFLVALGDLAAGWGRPPEGTTAHTLYTHEASGAFVHARAAAFFDGWILGSALHPELPVRELSATAQLDTGAMPEDAYFEYLLDSERHYPTYGDQAGLVQAAASRGKLFLDLRADESSLRVGNFQLALGGGGQLVDYRRTLYGGQLQLRQLLDERFLTTVQAFYADGGDLIAHRHLLFRGTGGALYFLRDRDLVEGSERLELVVRDRDSGLELTRRLLARDADYTIRYDDGRVLLGQPLPSVATSGLRLDANPATPLAGHPVYLEVSYDYRGDGLQAGASSSFGGWLEESFAGLVTVGLGAVQEARESGADYQLLGARLALRPLAKTSLTAELARSVDVDGDHFMSLDGGVSFAAIGWDQVERRPTDAPLRRSGWAVKAELSSEVGEWFGQPDFLRLGGYLSWQEPTFSSAAAILGQGQYRYGGQAAWALSEADRLTVGHDGSFTHLPALVDGYYRRVQRELARLQYLHSGRGWRAGLEYGHSYTRDDALADPLNADLLKGLLDLELSEDLGLTLEQQGVLGGDARILRSTWDHLATTLGARYRLAEWLQLTLEETVRWSGSNATSLGLRTRIGESTNVYANQRLTSLYGRWVSSTVVGGEQAVLEGNRTFAEYQHDAGAWGTGGRAVFGMDNQWELAPGLFVTVGYERSQLLGGASQAYAAGQAGASAWTAPGVLPSVTGSAGALPGETSAATTGAHGDPTQAYHDLYSPSLNEAGLFPLGVASRDALSAGASYRGLRDLQLSLRAELRFDDGDEALGAMDRLYTLLGAGGRWRFQRDLTLFVKANWAEIANQALGRAEAALLETTVGLAFRPLRHDWFSLLGKVTQRRDRRPLLLTDGLYERSDATVVALEPIVELPWRLPHGLGMQLAAKLALKSSLVSVDGMADVRSSVALALARYGLHLLELGDLGGLDLALEYRALWGLIQAGAGQEANELQHGALVELAWLPLPYLTVGLGYNFTHFTDDLLAPAAYDPHGVYLRVTGKF